MELLLRETPALLGRALIPLMPGPNRAVGGTAFLYNHLLTLGGDDGPDAYVTFLITARGMATGEYGFLGIPRHMVSDSGAAEYLVFQGWSHAWQYPADGRLGLAALPYCHLAEHTERKGYLGFFVVGMVGEGQVSADTAHRHISERCSFSCVVPIVGKGSLRWPRLECTWR